MVLIVSKKRLMIIPILQLLYICREWCIVVRDLRILYSEDWTETLLPNIGIDDKTVCTCGYTQQKHEWFAKITFSHPPPSLYLSHIHLSSIRSSYTLCTYVRVHVGNSDISAQTLRTYCSAVYRPLGAWTNEWIIYQTMTYLSWTHWFVGCSVCHVEEERKCKEERVRETSVRRSRFVVCDMDGYKYSACVNKCECMSIISEIHIARWVVCL